jgi:hypothetical protein
MGTLSFGLVPLLVRGAELVNHLRDSEVVWLRSKLPGCAGLSTAMLGSASRFGTVRSLFVLVCLPWYQGHVTQRVT